MLQACMTVDSSNAQWRQKKEHLWDTHIIDWIGLNFSELQRLAPDRYQWKKLRQREGTEVQQQQHKSVRYIPTVRLEPSLQVVDCFDAGWFVLRFRIVQSASWWYAAAYTVARWSAEWLEWRCQDTVCLATPSTSPAAWSPLENVCRYRQAVFQLPHCVDRWSVIRTVVPVENTFAPLCSLQSLFKLWLVLLYQWLANVQIVLLLY